MAAGGLTHEIFLTGIFILQVTGFLVLFLQGAQLSLYTLFSRAEAPYWRAFIVSIGLTIGICALEIWIMTDL